MRLLEESVLTELIGRGKEEKLPCKLLRPDSETLEFDNRLRLELDADGELIVNSDANRTRLRLAWARVGMEYASETHGLSEIRVIASW